jgi:hypothetical protein
MTRAITLTVWVLIAAALVGYWVFAARGRSGFPTAGDLLSVVMRSNGWRWAVLVGWMWLGWHFFVR